MSSDKKIRVNGEFLPQFDGQDVILLCKYLQVSIKPFDLSTTSVFKAYQCAKKYIPLSGCIESQCTSEP